MSVAQIFNGLPRLQLTEKSPLTRLSRLETRLGARQRIFIKRDDLGGIGAGGNKLRKLEFAAGAALQQGCDTLITFGALQSNHARLTAAVAARCGLRCELVLNRKVPRQDAWYEHSGNVLLDRLFGARLHLLSADADPLAYGQALRSRLEGEGRRAYVIPFGGSDALGAIGYAQCVSELVEQSAEQDVALDVLVHASGSGGTQAGLILGSAWHKIQPRILGVSVLHDKARLSQLVDGIARAAAELSGVDPTALQPAQIDDRHVGEGYGLPSRPGLEAIALLARTEGILLDPVYTGKAFAGLLHAIARGECAAHADIVFLHTGGLPGLFAYGSEFAPQDEQLWDGNGQ